MTGRERSMRAWSHNALRGSLIRSQRAMAWLLSYIATNSSVTPRGQQLARDIASLLDELAEELRTRRDP